VLTCVVGLVCKIIYTFIYNCLSRMKIENYSLHFFLLIIENELASDE
jgi:hypothetical protein